MFAHIIRINVRGKKLLVPGALKAVLAAEAVAVRVRAVQLLLAEAAVENTNVLGKGAHGFAFPSLCETAHARTKRRILQQKES